MSCTKPILIACCLLTSIPFGGHLIAQEITGRWLTTDGRAHVEIYPLEDEVYEGKLVWTQDKSQEALKFIGTIVLIDLVETDKGVYKGKAYDPERDSNYRTTIRMKGNDNMDIRGYIAVSLLGRTEHWTRVR